jgi:ATP-dependent DNA helicase MPH1
MPPPDLPARTPLASFDHDYPEPSFPVRPAGKHKKRSAIEPQSPVLDMPPPSQRRLQRLPTKSSPDRLTHSPRQNKDRSPNVVRRLDQWIDMEAIHSGDDSAGSSHGEDEVETEEDRLFLQTLPETQVSPSYDQTLAYRQSLISQAPSGRRAPVFANRPIRRGPFAGGSISTMGRRRVIVFFPPISEIRFPCPKRIECMSAADIGQLPVLSWALSKGRQYK